MNKRFTTGAFLITQFIWDYGIDVSLRGYFLKYPYSPIKLKLVNFVEVITYPYSSLISGLGKLCQQNSPDVC